MRRDYRAFVNERDGSSLYEYDVLRTSLDGASELHLATYGPLAIEGPGWG
jgi:hypothetical protein